MTGRDFFRRFFGDQIRFGVPLQELSLIKIEPGELLPVEFNAKKARALLKQKHVLVHAGEK